MRLALILLVAPLAAQDFSDYRIEKFTSGYTFTEGPSWSRDGYLLFSDVPNNRIWKAVPGKKPEAWRENTAGANGTAFDSRGNVLVCETRGRRVIRVDRRNRVEVVADAWEGKKLNAPDDIVVRKDNHIYFTDPAFGLQAQSRELDFYGIFHVPPRGPMEVIAKWQGRPNGIALTADGRILYVSNSDERSIHAFDLDGKGAASNERVVVKGIEGVPDGLALDEKGNIYVAAKELAVYSAAGTLLKSIEIGEMPRNCEFGDDDYQSLYVTAYTAVYRVRLEMKGAVQH